MTNNRESVAAARSASEEKLLAIRGDAQSHTPAKPAAPATSSPIGYYGLPVLKEPQWKWQVPVYFFAGGAAGAAALIACVGRACGAHPRLVRDARRLAACGALVSPPLLIADLGKPSRFLNMLRVFKPQSPMSVGSWTLMAFSTSALSAELASGRSGRLANFIATGAEIASGMTGLVLSTYTGVLLGVTAIPVWSENSRLLPLHFAASAMGSAVAILQLAGHETDRSLGFLATASALAETLAGGRIEVQSKPALQPLKAGPSGRLARAGSILSGPVPLLLRLLAGNSTSDRAVTMRRIAAASTVAGSLVTRVAWLKAGAASARDPQAVLAPPQNR